MFIRSYTIIVCNVFIRCVNPWIKQKQQFSIFKWWMFYPLKEATAAKLYPHVFCRLTLIPWTSCTVVLPCRCVYVRCQVFALIHERCKVLGLNMKGRKNKNKNEKSSLDHRSHISLFHIFHLFTYFTFSTFLLFHLKSWKRSLTFGRMQLHRHRVLNFTMVLDLVVAALFWQH